MRATEGVLIACDAPIKQFLLHLDEQQGAGAGGASFVISSDLDERHLLVKPDSVEMIQQKLEELQASNSFQRDLGEAANKAAEKEERPAKSRKRKET